jgi:predicted transcriptional regulator
MREELSRREREIMSLLYRRGRASAEEIRSDLEGELSNSAVRTMLGILEEKGFLRHEQEGKRYVYLPVQATEKVGAEALREVMRTFFDGSAARTVAALFDAGEKLDDTDFDRLQALIEKAQKEGR